VNPGPRNCMIQLQASPEGEERFFSLTVEEWIRDHAIARSGKLAFWDSVCIPSFADSPQTPPPPRQYIAVSNRTGLSFIDQFFLLFELLYSVRLVAVSCLYIFFVPGLCCENIGKGSWHLILLFSLGWIRCICRSWTALLRGEAIVDVVLDFIKGLAVFHEARCSGRLFQDSWLCTFFNGREKQVESVFLSGCCEFIFRKLRVIRNELQFRQVCKHFRP
jgi:hypothetical protein